MFTGLIEEVGRVASFSREGPASPAAGSARVRVGAELTLEGLKVGDSVSLDGVCQSVVAIHADSFEVQAVATTLGRTTLGDYRPGRRVNLERALVMGGRLGGHLVQGHVDGVGTVCRVSPEGQHTLIDIELPGSVAEVTVPRGSITVNGVSLTVNGLPAPGLCQLSLIPHTLRSTNLSELAAGDRVNLEGDVIGKYVRSFTSLASRGQEARS